jgi:hypothetical protein
MNQVPERTPADGGGAWRRLISNEDAETGWVFGYALIRPDEGLKDRQKREKGGGYFKGFQSLSKKP